MSSTDVSPPKYKDGYLMKKEGDKKWQEYWVVLQGTYLIFYIHKSLTGDIVDQFGVPLCNIFPNQKELFHLFSSDKVFCGCIFLNPRAKCVTAKRKNYSFPFYIVTDKARYLFKTSSNLNRHHWFTAIDLAAKGKPAVDHLGFLHQNGDQYFQDGNNNAEEKDNTVPSTEETPQSFSSNGTDEPADEYNSDNNNDEDEAYFQDPSPIFLINIQQVKSDEMQSCFLERTFPKHAKENPAIENDIVVTEIDKDQERLLERYKEIYCNDNTEANSNNKTMPKTVDEKTKTPVTSYGYPTFSNSKYLDPDSHERIKRLTKSAELLKGVPLNASSCNRLLDSRTSSSSNQNLQTTRNIFSRHLIASAPEVKGIATRHTP